MHRKLSKVSASESHNLQSLPERNERFITALSRSFYCAMNPRNSISANEISRGNQRGSNKFGAARFERAVFRLIREEKNATAIKCVIQ